MLIAVFIYWGWDSTVTVNEETGTPTEGPGKAALLATVILLAIYMVVSYAAQSYGGVQQLIDNQDDVLSVLGTQVFGSPLDKILIIAVLTSAAASTQTTILPTARTSLSMARAGAMPESLGARPSALPHAGRLDDPDGHALDHLVRRADDRQREHPVRLDRRARPDDRLLLRDDRLRVHDLLPEAAHESVKSFFLIGVGPTLGGLMLAAIFVKSCYDLSKPENSESGDSWFGLGPPLVIGVGFLILGAILMLLWRIEHKSSSSAGPRSSAIRSRARR